MKFCRNFADNLENVEFFRIFFEFSKETFWKIPILKEFEWFEWFEWFGPSPIEAFNSGRRPRARGPRRDLRLQHEPAAARATGDGGPVEGPGARGAGRGKE